jgi:hypothetical protein
MPRKKNDNQLDLFATAPKHLAKQFELVEVPGQDGKASWDQERLYAYEQNCKRTPPNLKPGDKATTNFCMSAKGLVFTIKNIYPAHIFCESGYMVEAESEEFIQRTGKPGLCDLDSNWFQKLLL